MPIAHAKTVGQLGGVLRVDASDGGAFDGRQRRAFVASLSIGCRRRRRRCSVDVGTRRPIAVVVDALARAHVVCGIEAQLATPPRRPSMRHCAVERVAQAVVADDALGATVDGVDDALVAHARDASSVERSDVADRARAAAQPHLQIGKRLVVGGAHRLAQNDAVRNVVVKLAPRQRNVGRELVGGERRERRVEHWRQLIEVAADQEQRAAKRIVDDVVVNRAQRLDDNVPQLGANQADFVENDGHERRKLMTQSLESGGLVERLGIVAQRALNRSAARNAGRGDAALRQSQLDGGTNVRMIRESNEPENSFDKPRRHFAQRDETDERQQR